MVPCPSENPAMKTRVAVTALREKRPFAGIREIKEALVRFQGKEVCMSHSCGENIPTPFKKYICALTRLTFGTIFTFLFYSRRRCLADSRAYQKTLKSRGGVEREERHAQYPQSDTHDRGPDDHQTSPAGLVNEPSGHPRHDDQGDSHRNSGQYLGHASGMWWDIVNVLMLVH